MNDRDLYRKMDRKAPNLLLPVLKIAPELSSVDSPLSDQSFSKLGLPLSAAQKSSSISSYSINSSEYPGIPLSVIARELRFRITKDEFTPSVILETLSHLHSSIDYTLSRHILQSLLLQKFLIEHEEDEEMIRFRQIPLFEFSTLNYDRFKDDEETLENGLPTGIFPSLSLCYSPTCTFGDSCYSISCPRILGFRTTKQQLTQNLSINTQNSRDIPSLWSDIVDNGVLSSISDEERKRQEIIYEIIKTEHEYVSDLQVLKKVYVEPLQRSDIIPIASRDSFISSVFFNLDDVITKNSKLSTAFKERQDENLIIDSLGDLLVCWSSDLHEYIDFGTNQALSKQTLDIELENNLIFQKFCEANERRPECRKLPIQSFLSRPTTRLGRYPILLETLIRKTQKHLPEVKNLEVSIRNIKNALSIINEKSGIAMNSVRLKYLYDHLVTKNESDQNDIERLNLLDPQRLLIREGTFSLKGSTDNSDIEVILLDSVLILCKKTVLNGKMMLQIKKRPIPLYLLKSKDDDTIISSSNFDERKSINSGSRKDGLSLDQVSPKPTPNHELQIDVIGKDGFSYTLIGSYASCKQWVCDIETASMTLLDKMRIYEPSLVIGPRLNNNLIIESICNSKITSSLYFDGRLLVGTDHGLYCGRAESPDSFIRIFNGKYISQMNIVDEFNMLLVLSEKYLFYFSFEEISSSLEFNKPMKGKKVSASVSFFKVGETSGKLHLITVRTKIISTYIKVFLYDGNCIKKKRKNSVSMILKKLSLTSDNEFQKIRDIYIPAESKSLHILKSKICVGCVQGYELVDLETLDTQALIDSSDSTLAFLYEKEHISPIGLFRVSQNEFLLAYQEFGVYVDKNGRNSRPEAQKNRPMISWIGKPSQFHAYDNHLVAFESNMIEIRELISGTIIQIIQLCHSHLTLCQDSLIQFSTKKQTDSFSIRETPKAASSFIGRKLSKSLGESTKITSTTSTSSVLNDGPLLAGHDRGYVSSLWTLTKCTPQSSMMELEGMEDRKLGSMYPSALIQRHLSFNELKTLPRVKASDATAFTMLKSAGSSTSSLNLNPETTVIVTTILDDDSFT